MEVSAWTIYWITRCDAICLVATILVRASAVIALFWIPACIDLNCKPKTIAVGGIMHVSMFLLSLGVAVFVPSTKQAAAILVIPKIANSQEVKDIGTGIVELAKEWIVELKPNKEEK